MDWDKLRIFHAVAEKGSLTHAGDVLHLSQSAVSRLTGRRSPHFMPACMILSPLRSSP